jgi:membrane protein DedA with SNARE-associated domain
MEILALFDLTQIQGWLEVGGYALLFAMLFSCGLGMPIPEDIPLTLGGYFVATQQWNLFWVGVLAWCGIIGGDCILYHLGKKYGLNITRVPFIGKHVTRERIEKAEHLFDRYGIWVVGVGRLFAGIRGAMVVAAGTIRYNFLKFIIADGLAALVSGGLFIALGYWGGKKIGDPAQIMKKIEPYKHWVSLGILVLAVLVILYIVWRRRTHKTPSQVFMDKAEPSVHK